MEQQEQAAANASPSLDGQAHIWQIIYRSAEPLALKCAVELHIADIIHSHGRPITLSQIASDISSPSTVDLDCLARVMKFLTNMKIFDATINSSDQSLSDGGETLYGLTPSSRWLLRDSELSLAPYVLMHNHPLLLDPWHWLSQCVRESGGGTAFHKAHGYEMWDYASVNPKFNKIFNHGLEATARITTKAMIAEYADGFDSVGTLVDVGGGTGSAMAEIVKAFPHIKATNFDLPHVVATTPAYSGVTHVGGDMFESIPRADTILMKSIMHDWSDEDCIRILKNCRKAIPKKNGKIVILDVVLQPNDDSLFNKVGMIFDLVMMVYFSGGKERTEVEWKKVLEEGGFPRYNIIKIPALQSIIEAYPE